MTRAAFLLPVGGQWLFHAPLHGTTALVNGAAARLLQSGRIAGSSGNGFDLLEAALAADADPPLPLEGTLVPTMLGIIPTRGCNMACRYCDFAGPSSSLDFMLPRTAAAAIDWAVQRIREAGHHSFHLQFFGGEPFAARDLVELAVHRARQVCAQHDLLLQVDATTNGYFGAQVRRFVADYFDGVLLSLDGPADVQDRQRPATNGRRSSHVVEQTAYYLAESPVDLCLRMCVTSESVDRMTDSLRWMIDSFNPSAVNVETLTPGPLAQRAGLTPPNPYAFACQVERCREISAHAGISLVYAAAEAATPRLSFCPLGRDALIVSPEGRLGACYLLPQDWRRRGLELQFGQIEPSGRITIDHAALFGARTLPATKPRCDKCFCRFSCAGGCHVNQTFPGCEQSYTNFCIQTRVLTACRLLRELGRPDVAQALIDDSAAMVRLAQHPSDSLAQPVKVAMTPALVLRRIQEPHDIGFGRVIRAPLADKRRASIARPSCSTEKVLASAWRIAPDMRWGVESRGLRLIDPSGGEHMVAYPEAAVWAMLDKGRSMAAIRENLEVIAGLDASAAQRCVCEALANWHAAGWVVQSRTKGGSSLRAAESQADDPGVRRLIDDESVVHR